ncbi:transposase [Peribacillus huizhouensis]|uniref:Transposase-like protein n=1 Tax=Peribacillus huizhouensis TaxID=1501239 RepID=A0ABR6CU43_9BACI|nr:transposase [Peribacillus huizhouensis]MBA9028525.1 transposase-like protein [Peribacillus huizhouensis]
MSKYTEEIKLQVVEERYLTGNESYKAIAESIGTTYNPDSHQVGIEYI